MSIEVLARSGLASGLRTYTRRRDADSSTPLLVTNLQRDVISADITGAGC
jgi:hypothetical protein